MPIVLPTSGTVPFSEWFRDVMPECPGLEALMAIHHIRDVCKDFCKRTWAYRVDASGVTVATQADYTFDLPPFTEPVGTLVVKAQRELGGEELEIAPAPERGVRVAPAEAGAPRFYTRPSFTLLRFYPTPDDAYTFTAQVPVRPTDDAPAIAEAFYDEYRLQIADGVKARLMAMPGKPWTSAGAAQAYRADYVRHIREAQIEQSQSYTDMDLMVDLSGGSF